jgi:iron complex transport system ATP-binding protein
MLEAKNLSLTIDKANIIKDINLVFEAGTFTCLAGANGSGKTLLLKILSGLLAPSGGNVILEGRPVASYKAAERGAKIRFIPSRPGCAFNYKAADLVLLGAAQTGEWWRGFSSQDAAASRSALQAAGAAFLAERGIFTLSDGELQRVFLAQALAASPKYLLPDEPTSHLDLKQKDLLFKLLLEISQKGTTVVCATHDIEAAKKYATHLCFLKEGRVFKHSPCAEVSAQEINQAYGI